MSEADEQKALVAWFRSTYPQYALSLRVSQSGGFRGAGRKGAIRTANITAMGGITGESDITICLPRKGKDGNTYGSLHIELKATDASHQATEKQLEYLRYHNQIGNIGVVCKGLDLAKATIKQYLEGNA